MYKETILLLLIGHVLADYYFQTDNSVNNQTLKVVLKHCLIYAVTMLVVILPLFSIEMVIAALIISLTHLIIDAAKFKLKQRKKLTYIQTVTVYIVDQLLHISIILSSILYLFMSNANIKYIYSVSAFMEKIQALVEIDNIDILSWLLILLLIYKPASITIRIVLDYFEPDHKKEQDLGIKNAGALIGLFERLIIVMMLYVGQYSAIGFVLTAKSIARYNRISEDPQFAEYYLLGTLLSSLIIIISSHLIF